MCWDRIIEDEQTSLKREPVRRESALTEQKETLVEVGVMPQPVPELVEASR